MASLFPRWMNALPTLVAVATLGGAVAVVSGVTYWFTPKFWEVGYMPDQPGSGFNHQIHAGMLGMDCRYCHTNVENAWDANIPTVSTCIGCHGPNKVLAANTSAPREHDERTEFIRTAYDNGESIPWINVHVIPDYATFPHAVHVQAGVSCYSCHGQIAGMPVVYQAESLSMSWCLDCHRNPEENLVPRDRVTDLLGLEQDWFAKQVDEREYEGVTPAQLIDTLLREPPQHCGACHF